MYGATVGRAAVLGIEACVNQACCAVYGKGRISLDFFYWWARLHRQDLIDLGYGSGQPNISQDTIRNLRIHTPSAEQQEYIVRYLSSRWERTESLLNLTKQHIQLLVERKQSMITAAVTGDNAVQDYPHQGNCPLSQALP
jgi:type I restriction enzyme S subunit